MRFFFFLALTAVLCGCPARPAPTALDAGAPAAAAPAGARPRLLAVGPRLLSNQTSQPISVWATHLKPGMTLELSGAVTLSLPLTVLDETHAFTRLPAHVESADGLAEAMIQVALKGGEGKVAGLVLVNDTHFPDLTALVASPDGAWLFALSTPDDHVYALELATKQVTQLQTADGPSALAVWTDPEKKSWLVVAHRFA
ncbi:MAG: MtsA protein, partial [Myxococcaceae bacterium]|nr:MtsA protein [Myxococcaceae bacterium]